MGIGTQEDVVGVVVVVLEEVVVAVQVWRIRASVLLWLADMESQNIT